MKIQYLGTAAAEGLPALFCECENCKRAAALGGKNIRSRSQALIDDRILIDYPADTYMHFIRHGIPLWKITTCLITHSHGDHLYPAEIEMRKEGFSHLNNNAPLMFYSAESGYKMHKSVIDRYSIPSNRVNAVQIKPFEPFEVQGYRITPVKAEHDAAATPVIYAIEREGESLLYAHDSSEPCKESVECLKALGKPFGLISLDCTQGNDAEVPYIGHMNLNKCEKLREKFIKDGIADENTIFVLNHFSHNGKDSVYDDFVEIAKKRGFVTSYDGMTIEF